MIERRINRLPKNEQIFNNSRATCQNTKDNTNFKHTLNYTEKNLNKKRINWPRITIYLIPPSANP